MLSVCCLPPASQELQALRSHPPAAAEVEEARKKGYQEGVAAEKKVGQGASEQVKKIMNQTYQTLSAQLKKQPSFTAQEVQALLLATIRVSGCTAARVGVGVGGEVESYGVTF